MATGSVSDADAHEFARLLSGPMIQIEVGRGDSRRQWNIHRTLLIHHSEVLEDQLDGDKSDRLELPDFDPAGFELLVKWMYQGKLDDVNTVSGADQQYEHAVRCHKLYQLCDRFGMEQLKNVAIDQYRRGLHLSELVPDPNEINEIYRQSPHGSPWRMLMIQIAARQIMDPQTDRDVSTYRDCFTDNPDFAIELVTAIREGTGGMLLNDPTEGGNDCRYHDHEAGPNCHIRGKGKVKEELKMRGRRSAPRSTNYDLPGHFHHHPPQPTPDSQARQARPQTTGSNVGSLRRRLTSPASSTTSMSPETATGRSPSLAEQAQLTRQAPRRKSITQSKVAEASPQAPGGLLPSFGAEAHHIENSPSNQNSPADSRGDVSSDNQDQASLFSRFSSNERDRVPRGIWEWTRLGRMGILSRKTSSPPSFLTTKAATLAVNGALHDSRFSELSNSGSVDDFSLRSSMATDSDVAALRSPVSQAQLEGLGISTDGLDPSYFSQTKGSSDDLVASGSVNGTPSPSTLRSGILDPVEEVDSTTSTSTATPVHEMGTLPRSSSPAQITPTESSATLPITSQEEQSTPKPGDRNKRSASTARDTPHSTSETKLPRDRPTTPTEPTPTRKANSSVHSPQTSKQSTPKRVPKYKIALASHLLSPARSTAS